MKEKEVNIQKTSVEELLKNIKEKSTIAGKKQKEANAKKKQLDIDNA